MKNSTPQILCVDLDGTLVLTDTLIESLILLLKKNIFFAFVLPIWVLKGKAYFKDKIAENVKLSPKALPYNQSVLNYIEKCNQEGAHSYLVTASHQSVAEEIANYLGIFTGYFGSSKEQNYKGSQKAKLLNEQFGKGQYDYIGNDTADLSVWKDSRQVIVASNTQKLQKKARKISDDATILKSGVKTNILSYLRSMRIHQWVKNVLILLPLILSHSILDGEKVLLALYGFILFSFAASGIYIFNDLIDIDHDRAHPVKSKRPIASGEVPVARALGLGILLWTISLSISFVYFKLLFLLIVGYIVLNFVYSTILKKVVLMDVVVLAGFYTVRIIIGSVMTSVGLSFWLLTFSLFVFFSLALVKRYSEIAFHTKKKSEVKGRGYHSEDELITTILGVASGLVSILVMALYIHDPHTRELYTNANWLWLTIPALLYWMSRLWLLAHRRMITDDPILFALKDIESYATGIILVIAFYMAV